MNKMYLVLGDWSDDGHGKSEKVLVEANVPVDDVKQAYKDSCKLTGVSFNHNEDFTSNKDAPQIAVDYEDPYIPREAMEIFVKKFGLTFDIVKEWDQTDEIGMSQEEFNEFEPLALNQESIVNAWIWFVRLSHPEIQIKTLDAKDEIPCINGYWDDTLNVQFGYGLYY